jgi:SAM-dependent methyltransferase
MKTYTTMRIGLGSFTRDASRLYRVRTANLANDVSSTLVQKGEVESAFAQRTGKGLTGCDVLVLGAGQTAREVVAFGVSNDVTAIDLDVIPQGLRPGPYVQLLRQNGAVRTMKTIGRKALGIDRSFSKALCGALGVERANPARYLQMDAATMSFPDSTFDLVYSFSVFEHLPDPVAVLGESIRVLRPGGMLSISVHLYSSEGGCHDLRIFAGERDSIPFWAQLRAAQKHTVIESCYMNEWRLGQWRALFDSVCPGGTALLEPHHQPYASELAAELASIRAGDELADYTDEELLSVNYRVVWAKPAEPESTDPTKKTVDNQGGAAQHPHCR